jgi:ATP-dependent Clp protease ATP-binding subunit ClpC
MKKKVMEEMRRTFRPEFLNRIDEIIVFHSLSREHIKDIVGLMVREVAKRLADNEIEVEVTEAAKEYLAREGFDEDYGARPLRRAIQKEIEDRLSEEMLRGTFKRGDRVRIDREAGGGLKVEKI